MSELGAYIKEKREIHDFSLRRFAKLADISHTEVKRIEDGVRKQPSPQVLRSIAAALSVPYEDIMAAAGYIDSHNSAVVAASVGDKEDLSKDERRKVNEYIAFIKSQRNRSKGIER